MAYNAQDLILAPYGRRWRMMRKICSSHLFSNKALNEFQDVRHGEVVRLVRDFAGRKAVVNVGEMVSICAVNALSLVLVGRRISAGDEEALQFKEMAIELTRLAGQPNIGDFLPWIDWLDLQGLTKKIKKSYGRFADFIEKIIVEHHRMNGDDQFKGRNHINDFLTKLIETKESAEGEEDKLTNINIKALLQDMFIAGTDTVSVAIEWILTELIRHPKLLARAQQEIDSIVGYNRLISESDLSKFSFLHCIVKESFRLHPPAPLSVPRMAIEDCVVDGFLIPKGATVLVNVWAIGRDPVSWPDDPSEFKPDRFGPSAPHENVDVKGKDFEFIPFGAGRRICAGMNLGLRMVHLVTATLVHSFDWTLADGDMVDMEESTGITMRKRRPLMAKAILRLAPEVYI
ncbi:Flavonoid 3'-monooxygenase [Dendrobium catenatum]|uniref:Flavonoid 3'-monooxygenase n=2 Tax=Dendrobium catenatum TaxID=906689 RepID=A0A2I0W8T4_9ASPA|nr:Flavonoid 3'-monooxygenase [Dendrobium catenatum]